MRIREEYKKSGYFWLPNSTEKKMPGTLSISDGGNIELEVVGLFNESGETLIQDSHLKRVVGYIEDNCPVTLENCFSKKSRIPLGGIAKSLWHVNIVLSGCAYDEGEEVAFNTFRFSVEGIDEWIGLTGIKVDRQHENCTVTITYQPPEEIPFNLSNGMQLLITFSHTHTFPGPQIVKEAKITQKTYFELTSKVKRDLNDFKSAAHKITNLLCFATDQTVCLEDVSATSDDIQQIIGHNRTSIPIQIYYPSLPFSKEEPKISWHGMLFSFKQIQKNAEKVFNNWFDAYNEIEPALDLYFSTKTGGQIYLQGKFLALVQGLETYHRRTFDEKFMDDDEFKKLVDHLLSQCPEKKREWLQGRLTNGNEINLNSRIKKIIEPFKEYVGASRERKKVIRSIVDTRNYLTHFNESLKSNASCGKDLYPLCLKMEALFQLHFLQILGFSQAEIKSIIDKCFQLKEKLGYIKQTGLLSRICAKENNAPV